MRDGAHFRVEVKIGPDIIGKTFTAKRGGQADRMFDRLMTEMRALSFVVQLRFINENGESMVLRRARSGQYEEA